LINAVTYLGLLAIVEPFGRKYELLKWASFSVPADRDIEPQLLAAIFYYTTSIHSIVLFRAEMSCPIYGLKRMFMYDTYVKSGSAKKEQVPP
jgi:hypothetical protein